VIQIGGTWYRPNSLDQLMGVMKSFNPDAKYRLVAGNTGSGNNVFFIGGGTTLTHLMELFEKIGAENPDYWYTPILAEHIGKIGSTPIRNVSKQKNGYIKLDFFYKVFFSQFLAVGKYCWKFDAETRAH